MTESLDDIYTRHLARVIESSDDAIVSKDLNGIITSWNRAAERIFGYTAGEAVGSSIRMIVPADRQTEEDEVLAKIRSGGSVDHFETVRQRKDGTLLTISLTVSPIRNEQGEVVGASKIARDVSEHVHLRELERTHAAITEKLHVVGTILASNLDRDAVVRRVTDIATEFTTAEVGAFFCNVIDPDSRESHALAILHGQGPVRLDDVTKDPRFGEGENEPYFGVSAAHLPIRSYLAVPVMGPGHEVLGGLFFGHSRPGVFTDQHERLALGIAAWARVALENARLYVEAREASRMKDEFLAVLSHELRTPLNAIVGYSRLLRGGLLKGEKAARGFEALDRNSTWLAQIVEDVLDMSRIISGKIRLDVQPVELPLVVHNAIATLQPAADAKSVRLQAIVDPRVGQIAGDRDRLQQVLWNLLSNAVKFTPRLGRVELRVERVNSHIEIAVTDTGIGIGPEFLPRIFERFTQAESPTTRKTGGLGLGLAIVRHIVELHGGTVEAFSAGPDQGSTFRVQLPTMIVHGKAENNGRQHPTAGRMHALEQLGDLRNVRVLAVDDEQDALALLTTVLETAGAQVTAVGSPHGALERISESRPDVVLLDLGMPEIDGFELIKRIRASTDDAVRRVPAAALTAFARAEDRTRALQSGFEMHLAKPIDPAELVASVARLVRRSKE